MPIILLMATANKKRVKGSDPLPRFAANFLLKDFGISQIISNFAAGTVNLTNMKKQQLLLTPPALSSLRYAPCPTTSASIADGRAVLPVTLPAGSLAIVRLGQQSVKVVMR